MKNIFLTLALLLTVSFAFAVNGNHKESTNIFINSYDSYLNYSTELNNEISGTCTVTVNHYNSFGIYTGSTVYTFQNVDSESDCFYIAKFVTFVNQ